MGSISNYFSLLTRNSYSLWLYGQIRSRLQPYINNQFEATEIIDGLWLGSICSCSNSDQLKYYGISTIITVAIGITPLYPHDFEYMYIPLLDTNENILPIFEQYLPLIHARLLQNQKILIHCIVGASRSASIVIAYLMKYHNFDLSTALQWAKNKRPLVNPNPFYLQQLQLFESSLHRSGHLPIKKISTPLSLTWQHLIQASSPQDSTTTAATL